MREVQTQMGAEGATETERWREGRGVTPIDYEREREGGGGEGKVRRGVCKETLHYSSNRAVQNVTTGQIMT